MKKGLCLLLAVLTLCPWAYAASGLDNFQPVNPYTEGQFVDVPPGSWCADAVRTVYVYGLLNGKNDSRFDPEGSLTIAQTLAIACRLHSTYYDNNADFQEGAPWYQVYQDYALENHILSQPYDNCDVSINRVAFAQIVGAALPDEALPVISDVPDGSIPDVPADSAYSKGVYRLYRAGILTGNDAKGTFAPSSRVTRGEAAAIVGRIADVSLRKQITLTVTPVTLVPLAQLANRKSLQRKASDAELAQAYEAAVPLVTPLAGCSREEQLMGIAIAIREMVDSGQVAYSTTVSHYNDPYGYFVLGVGSCAGCTRATGLCLNMLGIPYEHVNENQYSHQWCRVNINGTYWICDAYGLYCGPEPAPYTHPYL